MFLQVGGVDKVNWACHLLGPLILVGKGGACRGELLVGLGEAWCDDLGHVERRHDTRL